MPIQTPQLQPSGRSTALRTDSAFEGLTFQQLAYCKARMSGLNMSQSYIAAYDPKGVDPQSIGRRAWDLERNPKVIAKLRTMLVEAEEPTTLLPSITRDYVLNGIATMAATSTKEAVQLRAWELLGKAVGLFDRASPDDDRDKEAKTTTDIDAEIKRRLAGLLAPVVEGEARRVPSAPAPARRERRRKPRTETEGGQ
jgi:hypothetical protein